ncbi:MAG: LacI family DNA-binding transcriptional regulator [Opitutales bacterium]
MPRVRLQDIAEEMGISKSTVSLALRGSPKIPAATRARVRETAERLGYQPDPALAAAARDRWKGTPRGKGYTLAFLADQPADGIFVKPHLEGARAGAAALGYDLEFHAVYEYPSAQALSRILYNRGIQGLLLCHPHGDPKLWELDWPKFAILQVGRGSLPWQFHRVVEHSTLQMQMAVDHAVESDARRIGVWLFPPRLLPGIKQQIGRARYLVAHECPEEVDLRLWVDLRKPSAEEFVRVWEEFRPEIVITANPEPVKWLRAPGNPAAADTRVLWLDWIDKTEPGVQVNRFEAGRVGVSLLQSLLVTGGFGIPEIPMTSLIPPKWCEENRGAS